MQFTTIVFVMSFNMVLLMLMYCSDSKKRKLEYENYSSDNFDDDLETTKIIEKETIIAQNAYVIRKKILIITISIFLLLSAFLIPINIKVYHNKQKSIIDYKCFEKLENHQIDLVYQELCEIARNEMVSCGLFYMNLETGNNKRMVMRIDNYFFTGKHYIYQTIRENLKDDQGIIKLGYPTKPDDLLIYLLTKEKKRYKKPTTLKVLQLLEKIDIFETKAYLDDLEKHPENSKFPDKIIRIEIMYESSLEFVTEGFMETVDNSISKINRYVLDFNLNKIPSENFILQDDKPYIRVLVQFEFEPMENSEFNRLNVNEYYIIIDESL